MKTSSLAALSLCAAVAAAGTAAAQEPDITVAPVTGVLVPDPPAPDVVNPTVPQPPRSMLYYESKHPPQPVPPGPPNNVPQPNGPETVVSDPPSPLIDTGQFRYFQNTLVKPTGANSSPRTPEPSNGMIKDTILQTGNWQACLSRDNGETWTSLNPATFFPSVAGGFCCDQQVMHDASRDIVVWLLQYGQDANGNNAYRFAVAKNYDDLKSGSASDWTRWTFTPQGNFGYGNNVWFDYPDIAMDADWLYCRANAIGTGESVIWRMELADFKAGSAVTYQYVKSTTLGGWNHRLAKGSGQSRMGFAAFKSSTELYVYTWPTSSGSGVTRSTRSVASWTNAGASVPGPDGLDWAGRWPNIGAIIGAYGNGTEMGFMWGCSPQSGRAMPYVRVARFNLSDRTTIGETDIWNSTIAFLYPDAMSSSLGHVGGVLACGSATRYVSTACYLIDQYDAWPPNTVYLQGTGNSGPNQNRFGDYFTVRRHPEHPDTFISAGSYQVGGSSNANAQHKFVWFGRDDYEPGWVSLFVQSSGLTGVSITQDVTDMDGRKNGTTNYTRRFAPLQAYELTAPATVTSGSTTWAFERWRVSANSNGVYTSYPIGDRVVSISNIGNVNDTAIADYKVRRTLSVQSTNPSSGVAITVSASDLNGNQNGSTAFTRYYRDGEVVGLTAPGSVGFNTFKRWVVNGVVQRGNPINVSMTTTRTAVAEYWQNVAGSVRTIGAGCPGSSGLVPVQSITWPAGQQGPQQGSKTTYSLSRARPNTGGVLHFGIDNKTWNGFPLPFDLSVFGMTKCFLYHDLVVSPGISIDSAGRAALTVSWPVDPATIGAPIFSTFGVVDFGANPLHVVHSNAMETKPGGNR